MKENRLLHTALWLCLVATLLSNLINGIQTRRLNEAFRRIEAIEEALGQ